MRISTRQYFDISQQSMSRSAESAYTWQRRIASGVRVDRASEDPVAAGRSVILATRQSRIEMLKGNQDFAQSALNELDTTVGSMQNQLDLLEEVVVQAGNGVLSPATYGALTSKADQISVQFRNLANQKDSSGRNYLADEASSLEVQTGFSVNILLDRTEVLGAGTDVDTSETALAIDGIVNALKDNRAPTDAERAALKAARERLTLARTGVGLDTNSIESARSTTQDVELSLAQERSDLLDTDLALGVTEFTRAQTMLEAARSLFARINSTGLFSMLK